MTRIFRFLLTVALIVVVQSSIVDAATENDDGTVTLTWTATYIPFSWKFSIDPFPIQNGSLSWEYNPERAGFLGAEGTSDYRVISPGENDTANGLLRNIRFAAIQDPPSGDTVDVFDLTFSDIAQGIKPGPAFRVFADDTGEFKDGFNFPVDPQGNIRFDLDPEIKAEDIGEFIALAPVPEPASFVLVSLGALGLLALRRRN